MVSYTDLPEVIKYNDLKLHKQFKHGSINRGRPTGAKVNGKVPYLNGKY